MKKLLSLCLLSLSINLYADNQQALALNLSPIHSMTSVITDMKSEPKKKPILIYANVSLIRPMQLNMQITLTNPDSNLNKTLYIVNGTNLWIIKNNQSTNTKLTNTLNDLVTLPVLLAAEPMNFITENFNVKQIGPQPGGYTLTPKSSSSPIQQAQIFFTADGSKINLISINYTSGSSDTIIFYQVKNNPALDPKLFSPQTN